MALQNGTNQNDNSEPTKIEEVSGITNAVDLTNVEPVERLVQLNQTLHLFKSPRPPVKKRSKFMTEGDSCKKSCKWN
jgi:hypothetical protein